METYYALNGLHIVAAQGKRQRLFQGKQGILKASDDDLCDVLARCTVPKKIQRALKHKSGTVAFLAYHPHDSLEISARKIGKGEIRYSPKLEDIAREDDVQLGILSEKQCKVLFSTDTNVTVNPSHYAGILGKQKRALNNLTAELVRGHLAKLSHFDEESYGHEKTKASLGALLEAYLNLGYGPLEMLDYRMFLRSRRKHIEGIPEKRPLINVIARTASHISGKVLDLMHSRSYEDHKHIIIQLARQRDHDEERQYDLAEKLAAIFGAKCIAYKHALCLALPVDPNESQRVLKALRHESPYIREARLAHTYWIPELLAPVLEKPVRYTKKFTQDMLWNLHNIGVEEAHEKTKGKGAKVAIIDTGVDYTHPALHDRFGTVKGIDFVNGGNDPRDENCHGTHCCGTIAGKVNDSLIGVAPEATCYAVRVLNAQGYGSEINVIRGIEWCIDQGMNVVSMSLGSSRESTVEEEVCKAAFDHGVIVVAAAGNEGFGPSYPAAYPGVIAVAAVDRDNKHPSFSNVWDTNDISAPGVNIYSTYLRHGYTELTGTSMATPHISGVAALAVSLQLHDPGRFEQAMKKSAKHLGKEDVFGAGLVQAQTLVNAIGGARYGRRK